MPDERSAPDAEGTDTKADEAPPRRRRLRGRHALLLCLLVLIIALFGWRLYLIGVIESKTEAIRAAGEPATPAELNEFYKRPPEDENAAAALLELFPRVDWPNQGNYPNAPFVGKGSVPKHEVPLSGKAVEEIGRVLADNEAVLTELAEAAALPRSRYPVDLSKGYRDLPEIDAPHLSKLYRAANLLTAQALFRIARDSPAKAAESTRAVLNLAQTLEPEPLVRSQLARVAILSQGRNLAERLLTLTEPPEPALRSLEAAFSESVAPDAFRRTLIAERALGNGLFDASPRRIEAVIGSGMMDQPLYGLMHEWAPRSWIPSVAAHLRIWRYTGLLDLDRAAFLDMQKAFIQAAGRPSHERLAAVRACPKPISADAPFYIYVTDDLLGSPELLQRRALFCDAQLRAARTAMAVERYRLAQDRLPGSLGALTPGQLDAIPTDPTTGEPLRYRKRDDGGYTVYSLGFDGEDDGGKPPDPSKRGLRGSGFDFPFTVR